MPNAIVGITWKNEDEEVRQKVSSMSKLIQDAMKNIQDTVVASGAKSFGDYAKHVDGATSAAKKGSKEIKEGFLSASEAMALQAKKESDMRKKYEHDAGEAIIHDMVQLQNEKKRINNAILQDVSTEAKAELNERKKEVAEEIRLLDTVAKEKEKVMKGGVGAQAGIHGTGREITNPHEVGGHGGGIMGAVTALPGMGMMVSGMEKVIEKGKEVTEMNENLMVGFRADGSSAEQAEKAFAKNKETIAKLSDTYAISGGKIKDMQAIYLKMGGSQKDLAQNTENIIALAEKAHIAPEMAAKMLAGATDPEIEKGLTKAGIAINKNATAQERQLIITKALAPTLEGLKEKAQSPLAMFEKFQNVISSLIGTIGVGLIDALGPVLKIFGELAKQMTEIVMPIIKQIMGVIGPILKSLAETIGGILSSILPVVGELIKTLAGPLGEIFKIATDILKAVLVPVLHAVMAVLKPVIHVVSEVLKSLHPLFVVLGNVAGMFGKLIAQSPLIKILEMLGKIFEKLAVPIGKLVGAVATLAGTLLDALMPVMDTITEVIDTVLNVVIGALGDGLTVVIGVVVDLATILVDGLTVAIKWIVQAVKDGIEFFGKLFDVLGQVTDWIVEKMQPGLKLLSDAWQAVWGAIKAVSNFISDIVMAVFDALWSAVQWGMDNILNPLIKIDHDIFDAFMSVVNGIGDFISNLVKTNGPIKAVIGWINALIQPLKDAVGWLIKFFEGADNAGGEADKVRVAVDKATGGDVVVQDKPKGEAPPPETTKEPVKDKAAIAAAAKAAKDKRAADKKAASERRKSQKAAAKSDLDEYKAIQDEYTRNYEKYIELIDLDEANGVITKEEANKKKLQSDISYNAILRSLAENTKGHEDEAIKYELKMAQDRVKLKEAEGKELMDDEKALLKFKEDNLKDEEEMVKDADKAYDDEQNRKLRMMEDGLDKQLFAELIAYEKKVRMAKGNADELEEIELEHQRNMGRIRDEDVKKTSGVYRVLFAAMDSITTQGLDWLDAGWKKSFHNQQTVLFSVLSSASGALKGFFGDITKTLIEKGAIWIAKNLEIAASAMVGAVVAAIKWINTTFPFPANIAVIGTAVASLYGIYAGVKSLFAPKKLAQGGLLSRPAFAHGNNGAGFEAGEAGPELVAPYPVLMNDFKNMVSNIIANDKNHNELISVLRDIHKSTSQDKTVVVDSYQTYLGQIKSKNEADSREV